MAEFGRSDFVDPAIGNPWMGSRDRRLAAVARDQTTSDPAQDPLMEGHDAAGSTKAFPTVPDGYALFSRHNATVGMFPQNNVDYIRSLFIPYSNDEYNQQASSTSPPRSALTAMPVPLASPTASSSTRTPLSATVPGTPMTTDVQARPRPFVRQEGRVQFVSAAAGGSNTQGVSVSWDPLNANGVRVLYAVHGFHYEVNPTSIPFGGAAPNAAHAPRALRPGFFVATSGPVDPRSVHPTGGVAAMYAGPGEQAGSGQNTASASTMRSTRPLPTRGRQRRSRASDRQTMPVDAVQGSPSSHHASG
ncbi:hypothetical protein OH76DRAFT_1402003 [Lentinus brumalis]|uniref:Uncharacterized protein n=1 Tax=Lentinus brumalis TaxID=2498619 RepID=A0A371DE11_9APHY|nr:hypothetical protein OH76DRAFT_1402003 [Polyporus brumalis]